MPEDDPFDELRRQQRLFHELQERKARSRHQPEPPPFPPPKPAASLAPAAPDPRDKETADIALVEYRRSQGNTV